MNRWWTDDEQMMNWWWTDDELMMNWWWTDELVWSGLPKTTTDCHWLIGSTPLNTQSYLRGLAWILLLHISLTPPTTRAPLAVLIKYCATAMLLVRSIWKTTSLQSLLAPWHIWKSTFCSHFLLNIKIHILQSLPAPAHLWLCHQSSPGNQDGNHTI